MPATSPNTEFGLFKPRVSIKMHPKVETEDLLAFFQQLSTLFRAGTPIYEAIIIAGQQSQSDKLQVLVQEIAKSVAAGTALCDALAMHPEHFLTEWIEIIRSGEMSGKLGEVLVELTAQIDRARELRSKIVSALIYPAIVMSVALICVVVLIVKVVPTFAAMFESTGQELPGITQAVLDLSAFMQESGLMLLGGIVGVVWMVKRYVKTPAGRQKRDRLMVGMPLVGDMVVLSFMQRFANNVALLLRAGLPLNEALGAMAGIFDNNIVYQNAMHQVRSEVERGGQVADAAERSGVFTSFAVSMIRIGEQSGTMPQVLDEVEGFYRRQLETVVERITGSLETVVILFMGVTVAGILSAIYLPMFSMAGGVS